MSLTMSRSIDLNPVNFRGTNYMASIAYTPSKVLGWLPFAGGRMTAILNGDRCFDARHNDDELRALAEHGINNIRGNGVVLGVGP